MGKIPYDKYYTPPNVAKWCIEKTYEIIGKDNITEIIEPSAGNGMFSLQIDGCKAYDIYPQSETIIQADFIKLTLEYKMKSELQKRKEKLFYSKYNSKLFSEYKNKIEDGYDIDKLDLEIFEGPDKERLKKYLNELYHFLKDRKKGFQI